MIDDWLDFRLSVKLFHSGGSLKNDAFCFTSPFSNNLAAFSTHTQLSSITQRSGKSQRGTTKGISKKTLEPSIKQAQEGKTHLYSVDASHFVMGAFLTAVWSFKRLFIRTSSGRQRFNVLGALNMLTLDLLTVVNDSYINAGSVCEFLQKLRLLHSDDSITLILDNAAYQRCWLVQSYARLLNIELLFLPSYSPNLNLIERLWKFVKRQALYNVYYETFSSFKAGITNCLQKVNSDYKSTLKTTLTLKFHIIENQYIIAG
ncbi:MAG: IS630 family transposase [Prevotella sp.]|nr:IS630 family transposase [Prevotella sp.]